MTFVVEDRPEQITKTIPMRSKWADALDAIYELESGKVVTFRPAPNMGQTSSLRGSAAHRGLGLHIKSITEATHVWGAGSIESTTEKARRKKKQKALGE